MTAATRGHTARQPRNTQQQEQKDKRSGGGNKEEHGSRQGAERDQADRGKKERYKYLRERREKNAAETRKSM